MAKSYCQCSEALDKILRDHKKARGTMSADYFRKITGRQRIEDGFIDSLNEYATENYSLAVYRVDQGRFVLFRTTDKYFDSDPYAPTEED